MNGVCPSFNFSCVSRTRVSAKWSIDWQTGRQLRRMRDAEGFYCCKLLIFLLFGDLTTTTRSTAVVCSPPSLRGFIMPKGGGKLYDSEMK